MSELNQSHGFPRDRSRDAAVCLCCGARAFGFSRPQNNMSSSDSVMTSPSTIISSENKLGAFSQTQPEKPFHYTYVYFVIFFDLRPSVRVVIIFFPFESSRYLKEFRVEQCPLFLQHKCTAHRPFTCFHWHFMNQRRRRPKKKRDGTFNYSPDVYCTQYDETSGICPSGDEYVPGILPCILLVYLGSQAVMAVYLSCNRPFAELRYFSLSVAPIYIV